VVVEHCSVDYHLQRQRRIMAKSDLWVSIKDSLLSFCFRVTPYQLAQLYRSRLWITQFNLSVLRAIRHTASAWIVIIGSRRGKCNHLAGGGKEI
jgi:hypothetical protein